MWTALGMSVSIIGLVVACGGFISIIKPIRKLNIKTRDRAAVVFFVGLVLFITGPFIDLTGNPPPLAADEKEQPAAEPVLQLAANPPPPTTSQNPTVVTSTITSEMTIEYYIRRCAKISAAEFKDKCKGKTVIFEGKIRQIVQKDTLEVNVYSGSGREQGFDLLLSKKLPWEDAWETYEGRRLTFSGTLKDNSYSDHDIEDGVIVSVSPR